MQFYFVIQNLKKNVLESGNHLIITQFFIVISVKIYKIKLFFLYQNKIQNIQFWKTIIIA